MTDELTVLQQVKAQALVLVPLIRKLETELGADRARSILRDALSEYYRSLAMTWVEESGGDRIVAFGKFAEWFGPGEAFVMEPRESPPGRIHVDVVRCEYAKFFQAIGEPELGFLLLCSADYPIGEVLGMGLERSQTIMQGADHCDFQWILAAAPAGSD